MNILPFLKLTFSVICGKFRFGQCQSPKYSHPSFYSQVCIQVHDKACGNMEMFPVIKSWVDIVLFARGGEVWRQRSAVKFVE